MSVYRKLQAARQELSKAGLKKSGLNSYGGWKYYELADFMPTVHHLFDAIGLCGVVSFDGAATLTIYDTETGQHVVFSTPIVYAESAKGQPIQLLGSTHTYLRRYLWLLAMEIVEADSIDAAPQEEHKEPVKIKPPAKIQGRDGEWQLKVKFNDDGDIGEWANLVISATKMMLDVANSEADVKNIFKANRVIYDEVKAKSPTEYENLLAIFKSHQEVFKKEKA